ncbi:hypothetical protein D3C74_369100 [compost metagenome]
MRGPAVLREPLVGPTAEPGPVGRGTFARALTLCRVRFPATLGFCAGGHAARNARPAEACGSAVGYLCQAGHGSSSSTKKGKRHKWERRRTPRVQDAWGSSLAMWCRSSVGARTSTTTCAPRSRSSSAPSWWTRTTAT